MTLIDSILFMHFNCETEYMNCNIVRCQFPGQVVPQGNSQLLQLSTSPRDNFRVDYFVLNPRKVSDGYDQQTDLGRTYMSPYGDIVMCYIAVWCVPLVQCTTSNVVMKSNCEKCAWCRVHSAVPAFTAPCFSTSKTNIATPLSFHFGRLNKPIALNLPSEVMCLITITISVVLHWIVSNMCTSFLQ